MDTSEDCNTENYWIDKAAQAASEEEQKLSEAYNQLQHRLHYQGSVRQHRPDYQDTIGKYRPGLQSSGFRDISNNLSHRPTFEKKT